jgi:tRNA(Ile)-lysidine synthase
MTSSDLVDRLLSFLDEHTGSDSSFLLGVSGGCDSMALMDVFARARRERNLTGDVLHYNHRLHERAGEARDLVRAQARDRELTVVTASAYQPAEMKRTRRGLEAEARDRRYEFFGSVAAHLDASGILLAHHRRDQVETVLLNLGRGTGPGGLSGMESRAERNSLAVLRPFLSVPAQRLEEYVRERDLPYVEDPSNEDVDRSRNRIRHRVLPEWEKAQPDPESAIVGLSERMKRENDFWQEVLADQFDPVVHPGEVQVDRTALRSVHSAVQFRYLHHLVNDVLEAGRGMNATNYRDLRDLFMEGRSGARLSLPGSLYAINEYDRGCISLREPPVVPERSSLSLPVNESLGETGRVQIHEERGPLRGSEPAFFCRIAPSSAEQGRLRGWKEGDCFQRDGASSKLKELFGEWKIPYRARRCWPILSVNATVVAVPGLLHEENLRGDPLYFGFRSDHPVFDGMASPEDRSSPPYILQPDGSCS